MTCNLSYSMIKYYWKRYAASIRANAATEPIGLTSGASATIYFQLNKGALASLDLDAQTTVNIFASKAGTPAGIAVSSITNTE